MLSEAHDIVAALSQFHLSIAEGYDRVNEINKEAEDDVLSPVSKKIRAFYLHDLAACAARAAELHKQLLAHGSEWVGQASDAGPMPWQD